MTTTRFLLYDNLSCFALNTGYTVPADEFSIIVSTKEVEN